MPSGNDNANANGNVNPDKWKAALSLTKRTQQLNDAREVLITHTATGQPIWTTAGQNRMTAADKEELSANLAEHRRMAAVQDAVKQVFRACEIFVESTVCDLAQLLAKQGDGEAKAAFESLYGMREDQGAAFMAWGKRFKFRREGLTGILLDKDSEVARFTAKVDPRLEESVLHMLRFEEALASSMLGGGQ